MGNDPLVAVPVTPKLRASEEEGAPAIEPHHLGACWVCLTQELHHTRSMLVHVLEPRLGCELIVPAVHVPVLHKPETPLKVEQEVGRWHGSTGEKVASHPISFSLRHEMVIEACVNENVHEELATRPERTGHAFEEQVIVFHVLHHLNGHHPVETRGVGPLGPQHRQRDFGEFHFRDVASDDADVREALLLGLAEDVATLTVRVGDTDDQCVRQPLGDVQRRGAPPTAQVQNSHAILQAGALDVLFQRALLGFREQLRRPGLEVWAGVVREDAARVLLARPEPKVVQLGRDLIMLLVRVGGADRDGHRPQGLHEGQFGALVSLDATMRLLLDLLRELEADPRPCGPVRQAAAVQ
mmetsp:Transcript_18976/g.52265  ORF Transcript_18976/g.52265 Transcript_18976/m.52265 type:complete len:354 (-) Transcript_18976:648-1709(-)